VNRENRKRSIVGFCVAMVGLLATGCGGTDPLDKYERRDDRIADALSDNDEVGLLGNKAVWLVKTSSAAPNDRLSAYFGYTDNYEACLEVVNRYKETYPTDTYRCEIIN
tara:strand:+ start:766 stop:1092 length:327 start_codon:yes stop_codon:yes gene_type:complete